MFLFLADVEALAGGAGWVGAGLLGLVLGWLLLKHLPDKDKQLDGILQRKEAFIRSLLDTNVATEKESRKEFRESLNAVVNHCREEMQTLANIQAKQVEETAITLAALRTGIDHFRELYFSKKPS